MNKDETSDTEAYKIYANRDDFDFDIVNSPFWDGNFPHRLSYGVYFSTYNIC